VRDASELKEGRKGIKYKWIENDTAELYFKEGDVCIASRNFTVLENINAAKLLFDRLESFGPNIPWYAVTANHLWSERATDEQKAIKSVVGYGGNSIKLTSTDHRFVSKQWQEAAEEVKQRREAQRQFLAEEEKIKWSGRLDSVTP
jgi:hypothetical protein